MKHALGLIASLTVFWLGLSGHYTPMLLSFGVASVALVVWLSRRMHIVDHEGQVSGLRPRILLYWLWLGGEMLKSAWRVSQQIWGPMSQIQPVMRRTANTDADDLHAVIYANSITLTPGTLSVVVDEHEIEVHALEPATLDALDEGSMRRKVEALHR